MSPYLRPDVLVSTNDVAEHLTDPRMRILECDSDSDLYAKGHIPGALNVNYVADLCVPNSRDCIGPAEFEALAGRLAIGEDTPVLFYGDQNNILACYAYWVFRLYGHPHLKVMNGGRQKWIDEKRPLTKDPARPAATKYRVKQVYPEFRALREDVLERLTDSRATQAPAQKGTILVDDRTAEEFRGEFLDGPQATPRFLRGGHIPGAVNLPWKELVANDGTFKSADDLRTVLFAKGITPDKDVVVYTRIGERSSMLWFAIHELMGFPRVSNYDGSWTEWGNLVGAPIESGTMPMITLPSQGRETTARERRA